MAKHMLFLGMREIKKQTIKLCVLVLVILLVGIILFVFFWHRHNMKTDFSVLCNESKVYTASDIFKLEFDKAYINDRQAVYVDASYFEKTLGVLVGTDIKELQSGAYNHILFIKNDTIILDYIYATNEIEFTETDIWIYPDTILTAEKTAGAHVNAEVIQITVQGRKTRDKRDGSRRQGTVPCLE